MPAFLPLFLLALLALGLAQAKLTMVIHQVDANETSAVLIQIQIQGKGRVLERSLPSQDAYGRQFQVLLNGTEVAYLGRLGKLTPSAANSRITLPDGGKTPMAMTLDISTEYDFSQPGTYSVQYSTPGLLSNTIFIHLSAGIEAPEVFPRERQVPCTGNRLRVYRTALTNAQTLSKNAIGSLEARESKYVTWFGKYTNARAQTVLEQFTKIHQVFVADAVTPDCGCATDMRYYAYTYSTDLRYRRVYLCGGFFAASQQGADSKPGVLIHEVSHFRDCGNTNDYQYGQRGCLSLARNRPARAIKNADSHEFFAEL